MAQKLKKIEPHHIALERFSATGSRNHQFSQLKSRVYSAYAKTVVHILALVRLHPADHSQVLDVLLASNESSYDFEKKVWAFDYATDAIELYSAEEDEYFRSMNASMLKSGKLIPYGNNEGIVPDTIRPILNDEIRRIVMLPTVEFVLALAGITEITTLRRIERAMDEEQPLKKHTALAERIREIGGMI